MRLGLAFGGTRRVGHPASELLSEYVQLARAARDCGFTHIEAGTHFLSDTLMYVQNIPLLSRLAPETGTMKLVLVLPLPLLHPVVAAEMVASLDHLTEGRLIFSVGLGYRDEEFRAFGLERAQRVPRMLEALQIMKLLWARDDVHFEGRFWTLQGVTSGLKPAQSPHPPIWLATSSEAGVRRAARLGLPWHADSLLPSRFLVSLSEVYWGELSAAGQTGTGGVVLQRNAYLARDRAQAARYLSRQLSARRETLQPPSMASSQPSLEQAGEAPSTDGVVKETCVFGTPEEAIEQLQELRGRTSADLVVLRPLWADMTLEEMVQQVQLFGERVAPRL